MGEFVPHHLPARRELRRLLACAALLGGLLAVPRLCSAARLLVPSAQYYGVFGSYYDGDYRDLAPREFQMAGRGGIRSGTNRWIDSICYYTMVGECYYQMGQHQQSLVQYSRRCNCTRPSTIG